MENKQAVWRVLFSIRKKLFGNLLYLTRLCNEQGEIKLYFQISDLNIYYHGNASYQDNWHQKKKSYSVAFDWWNKWVDILKMSKLKCIIFSQCLIDFCKPENTFSHPYTFPAEDKQTCSLLSHFRSHKHVTIVACGWHKLAFIVPLSVIAQLRKPFMSKAESLLTVPKYMGLCVL